MSWEFLRYDAIDQGTVACHALLLLQPSTITRLRLWLTQVLPCRLVVDLQRKVQGTLPIRLRWLRSLLGVDVQIAGVKLQYLLGSHPLLSPAVAL